MQAQAILFRDVQKVVIEPVEIPPPGLGEVLIKTSYSTISPGTELRCLAGRQPNAAPWPVIPGYSLSGRIVARGEGVDLPLGTPVFAAGTRRASVNLMWGGHVAYAVTPVVNIHPLPEGVSMLAASALHLAAIAYHGLRLARPLPHETVVVLGLGAIGQMSARLFSAAGAHVLAADLSPARVALAQAAGVEAFTPIGAVGAAVRQRLPAGADIVVDATGAAPVLHQAIEIARELGWDDSPLTGARIVVQGSYPEDISIPYQAAFLKEANILVPRDMQPRDVRAVLDLMMRARFQIDDLLTAVVAPDHAPEMYARLRQTPDELVTAIFAWEASAT
ncbi:MAG TPA: zinc-binding alcohol dehydrogenase [Chloroflexi bacterium]|nr:zinc-binding alcohol dehydrogenase [Chloroflexota bacterium]